jgi:RNA polymerase sigma-70 factor, ECF subfamily
VLPQVRSLTDFLSSTGVLTKGSLHFRTLSPERTLYPFSEGSSCVERGADRFDDVHSQDCSGDYQGTNEELAPRSTHQRRRVEERGIGLTREADKELAFKAGQGDREAYRRLVEKYQQRLYFCAFEILKSKEDAEDVVQEAFVKAYLSLKHFKGESSVFTWLYRITSNLAIDYRRKLGRRGGESFEVFDESSVAPRDGERTVDGPAVALERRATVSAIEKALSTLSDEHRNVVVLRELDGLSYAEIAESMAVSVGTVMSRLHYARKKLQEVLRLSGESR